MSIEISKSVRRFAFLGAIVAALLPLQATSAPAGKAEHVVIVVWDGMRPDFITPEHTPTLFQLSRQGTFFKNHHPVYLSTTEVNATALSTGAYPARSGIIANREYRPEIDDAKSIATEDEEAVRAGDAKSSGHYIAVPTLAEIVQRAGYPTAVMGCKSVALLLDRANVRETGGAKDSVDFFKGKVLPASAMQGLIEANDGRSFPQKITYPNVAQDEWTTRGLTRGLWSRGVPKLSVLWMSDPDYTQHDAGPGSAAALGALESVDRNLATLLKALEEKNVREKTDIFVVSDHGFSTTADNVDVAKELSKAGFHASRTWKNPARGDVLVVGLGGSVSFYVQGHDKTTIRKLVTFLQGTRFAGVVFSRLSLDGTFPLKQVRVDAEHAPDVLLAMKWRADKSETGAPGLLIADAAKKGAHGSLSPFDMHNTLVAAGPDFRVGFTDELPSGNTDVAPTVLWILGIKAPKAMDGRILSEAVEALKPPAPMRQRTIEASAKTENSRWHQYLKFSTVGDTIYFDEGNGEVQSKAD